MPVQALRRILYILCHFLQYSSVFLPSVRRSQFPPVPRHPEIFTFPIPLLFSLFRKILPLSSLLQTRNIPRTRKKFPYPSQEQERDICDFAGINIPLLFLAAAKKFPSPLLTS